MEDAPRGLRVFPRLLIHADWGTAPSKRWAAGARLDGAGYQVSAPRNVVNPLRDALDAGGTALVGFDFPIGIPLAYSQRIGCTDFLELLLRLGRNEWARFFEPADAPEEVSLQRPFYPRRPGGTSQRQLLDGLGFDSIDELRRCCDRAHPSRPAAEVLFWTLGPRQVGRAAIAGWRDILIPALDAVRIWPFQGTLEELSEGVVVCETYPGEFYGHLGLPADKTAAVRRAAAPAIVATAASLGVQLDEPLREQVAAGFATDDAYDAFIGLLGMINVVLGRRAEAPPLPAEVRQVEGWMLGRA